VAALEQVSGFSQSEHIVTLGPPQVSVENRVPR
jgi:hypothetical protein